MFDFDDQWSLWSHMARVAARAQNRVLIVDDQAECVSPLTPVLDHMGIGYEIAFHVPDALRMVRDGRYDLVILDWVYPDGTGDRFVREAERMAEQEGWIIPFVVHSGLPTERIRIPETRAMVFNGVWSKPMSAADLVRGLNQVFDGEGI